MDGTKNKPGFASIITESQPETKAELQGIHYSSSKLFIGIPKQENLNENRVALSPMSVKQLVGRGHRVVIENGAGERSGFSNSEYSEAGAEVAYSKKEVFLSSILITVSPPSDDEIDLLHADQILISPLHLPLDRKSVV